VDLSYRALSVPKKGSSAEQCEDASEASADSSVVAVSDGAGSAFESRNWARLLTRAFVERPPFGLSRDGMLDWVEEVAVEWSASIPWQNLTYYQEEKASEGSSATLVGLRLGGSAGDEGLWQCIALGDSCLFQVTEENHLTALPITSAKDFTSNPPLLYTRREITETQIGKMVMPHGNWRAGDRFFLLTDALAKWFLQEAEHGGKPWDTLTSLDPESFRSFVDYGRSSGMLENDDVTAVILDTSRVTAPVVPVGAWADAEPEPGEDVTVPVGGRFRHPPPRDPRWPVPDRAPSLARRLAPVAVGLVVGLVAGILIGRATASPSPAPPTVSQADKIKATALAFGKDLVNFNGNPTAYESAVDGYATPALNTSLAQVLHLSSAESGSVRSQGRVESIAVVGPTGSAADVYVTLDQTVSVKNKSQRRNLLVLLAMTRSGDTWLVNGIKFIPAVGQLFPQVAPGNAGASSTSSTK